MSTENRDRIIIHADLDAFYASVEQLDNPELRGKPVVVGGSAEGRGVVAAASYEARRFGVRSAMPMSRALRLCPEAVRVSPRFDRYGQVSRDVMAIFRSITPLVEPLSLDEAFLDVTEQAAHHGGAEVLARSIKQRVKIVTGLNVSIGVGANKTVAKIASDLRKPDALVVVPRGTEAEFLAPLPVRTLWGIGPKTEEPLKRAGIRTIGDLAARHPGEVARLVGAGRGEELQAMACGIDERAVEPEQERKSVGAETTFARDLPDGPELRRILAEIAREVAMRLRHNNTRGRTIALKMRYANFRTITRQATLAGSTDDAVTIEATASSLLDAVSAENAQFRLLGIQATNLEQRTETQAELPLP